MNYNKYSFKVSDSQLSVLWLKELHQGPCILKNWQRFFKLFVCNPLNLSQSWPSLFIFDFSVKMLTPYHPALENCCSAISFKLELIRKRLQILWHCSFKQLFCLHVGLGKVCSILVKSIKIPGNFWPVSINYQRLCLLSISSHWTDVLDGMVIWLNLGKINT